MSIFLNNSGISSIKLGDSNVSKIFLGGDLVFPQCLDSTSKVKMTGWVAGARTLSPIGYAPYGHETYTYGDETVRYETGVWIYSALAGEITRAYSSEGYPWLVNWPSPYAAQKVCAFGSSGFQWMTMNSITESTASGIGQNNITVDITQTGGGMFTLNGMHAAYLFPPEYGVPTSGNQIANIQAGVFTAVFSSPVTDALVAFASVGQAGGAVPVLVLDENGNPKPFTVIWDSTSTVPNTQTTYQNPVGAGPEFQYTQFIGQEGFNIIRIDGTMSSVTFNYTVSENYCTVCFGFVDQNV